MNTHETGEKGEDYACKFLAENGVEILERNFRCRMGEIDIIGKSDGYLIFFEVKYRKTSGKGTAGEAVGIAKQTKICRVSDYYRMKQGLGDNVAVRFDVVTIDGGEIQWMQNAFPYQYH